MSIFVMVYVQARSELCGPLPEHISRLSKFLHLCPLYSSFFSKPESGLRRFPLCPLSKPPAVFLNSTSHSLWFALCSSVVSFLLGYKIPDGRGPSHLAFQILSCWLCASHVHSRCVDVFVESIHLQCGCLLSARHSFRPLD